MIAVALIGDSDEGRRARIQVGVRSPIEKNLG